MSFKAKFHGQVKTHGEHMTPWKTGFVEFDQPGQEWIARMRISANPSKVFHEMRVC